MCKQICQSQRKEGRDYRSSFNMGYAKGMADAKGVAMQKIADVLTIIAYVKTLEFTNGPGVPFERDQEAVIKLEEYLADLLPVTGAHDQEREDNGGADTKGRDGS